MIDAEVRPVPLGTRLLDCDVPLTQQALSEAWEDGWRGIIRYVGFGVKPWPGDLTLKERDLILGFQPRVVGAAGFGLMVVQHPRTALWTPTDAWGRSDGDAAVTQALGAGYLPGSTLWNDIEGISEGATDAIISHANIKHAVVSEGHFEPGEYIGDRCRMSSTQLFRALLSRLYWKSGSSVPDVERRGYCMVQTIPSKQNPIEYGNISFDWNLHGGDRMGGVAHWTIAASAPKPPPPPTSLDAA